MIRYLRRLTGRERSEAADRHLARLLTFVAGAVNAGGFLAVRQYTSHMSGIVSAMADDLAIGDTNLVVAGMGAVASFLAGAAFSAILVNWGRRHSLESEYAFPLVVESILLVVFGLVGHNLAQLQWLFIPATVMLLCFVMGFQNAIITKLSNARIRTTHITGMTTDVGIELGKFMYWNLSGNSPERPPVKADTGKLIVLSSLVALFFLGGLVGAVGFSHLGFSSTLFLAALLLASSVIPLWDDLRMVFRKTDSR